MIFKKLIINQWRESTRSKTWNRQVGINIFIGILYSLLAINLLSIGFFLNKFYEDTYPGEDPVALFNRFLCYYIFSDLLARYFLQKIHGISLKPYLHLPIKRSTIKHYLLSKSFIGLFNITPFLLIIPFAFTILIESHTAVAVFIWLLSIFLIFQSNNFLNLLVNRLAFNRPAIGIIYFIGLAIVVASVSSGLTDLPSVTENYFAAVLDNPVYTFIPLALMLIFYRANYKLLEDKLYLHQLEKKRKSIVEKFSNVNLGTKFGHTGAFIGLEIKMLLRNKRPKSFLAFAVIMLLFGFWIYTKEIYRDAFFFYIYMSLFIIGSFMIIYGQFTFAWESSYFDSILSQRINLINYINSKYVFLILLATVNFIVTIPYVYLGTDILYRNLALFAYNLGVNSYVLLMLGTFSKKRFDLTAGVMSQQGKGANQFVAVLPILVLPILLFIPFKIIGGETFGYAGLATLGALGLVFNTQIIKLIAGQFLKRKYKMAEGFREPE